MVQVEFSRSAHDQTTPRYRLGLVEPGLGKSIIGALLIDPPRVYSFQIRARILWNWYFRPCASGTYRRRQSLSGIASATGRWWDVDMEMLADSFVSVPFKPARSEFCAGEIRGEQLLQRLGLAANRVAAILVRSHFDAAGCGARSAHADVPGRIWNLLVRMARAPPHANTVFQLSLRCGNH